MDEEEINETPAPEAPEESTIEESAEESLDQILDEELTDNPVAEEEKSIIDDFDYEPESSSEKAEEPSIDESIEESVDIEPAEELVKDEPAPVEEPQDETQTLAEEATPEAPAEETTSEERTEGAISEQDLEAPNETGNTEPDVSTNPEDTAEQAQASPSETEEKPKSNKPLLFAIIIFLILAIGGAGIWYYLLNNTKAPTPPVQSDIEAIEPIDNTKAETISGNELSDFDLSFLRLENNQDNLIYSPLSIKYALAMLSDASAGETKEQIDAVIGDYTPKAYLNSANRSLANGIFIRNAFAQNVKSTYIDTLKNKYYAEVNYDSFDSPDNANKWVEDKTLGIIKNTFSEYEINHKTDYVLINALAIDMKWKNQLQCAKAQDYINGEWVDKGGVPCIKYGIKYVHEKYEDHIYDAQMGGFAKHTFNGNEDVETAEVAATYNKYDIINELGEDSIRETVQNEYNSWLDDVNNNPQAHQCVNIKTDFDLDEYINTLSENYGKSSISSDYYFNVTENEKVFAKDLQEYDGSTLQYIGIMPTDSPLNNYVKTLTAEKVNNLISNLKDVAIAENFKEGVVTKLKGYVPFFKFNFTMDKFMNHLQSLGITDVFSTADADLSGMLNFDKNTANKPYIDIAVHKADIDFSNDGIKAAAVTAFGGMGAGCIEYFDYEWDVPVEEIDLIFDKPFLFLIRDKSTGEVWFVGTVYESYTNQ